MKPQTKRVQRLKALQERFQNKQINRLISFTKECPLSRPARVVYSLLLFRCRREKKHVPASISRLSRLSGMHRSTVAKALKELALQCVVHKKEELWCLRHTSNHLRMPNPEWYGWRNHYHGINDLAYNWYLQPSQDSPLSLVDALVLSADLQGPVPACCLAVRLRMDKKTVKRARRKIRSLNYSPEWFADIRHKKKTPRPKSSRDFMENFGCDMQKGLVADMLRSNPPWSQDEILRFFQIAKEHCPSEDSMFNTMLLLLNPGDRSFDQCMREHRNSGREGCGMGLVLRKLGWK